MPEDVFRKIRVAVSGGPGPAHAGEVLTFRVGSSGTGYAWVFTANGSECLLAFPHHPDGSAVADDENFIAARQSLTFPRPGPFGAPDRGPPPRDAARPAPAGHDHGAERDAASDHRLAAARRSGDAGQAARHRAEGDGEAAGHPRSADPPPWRASPRGSPGDRARRGEANERARSARRHPRTSPG